jgi:formate hydrogenlyase subunit 3/multisubunit Na+/H+ antiporter MnhD subunit
LSARDGILLNWLLLFPFVAAAMIALFPRVLRYIPPHEHEQARSAPGATAITALGLSLAVCAAAGVVISRGGDAVADYLWTPDFFQLRLRLDSMGAYAALSIMAGLMLTALWAAGEGLRDYVRWAGMMAAAGAFMGMVLAADLVLLYVFWEMAALGLWVALAPLLGPGKRYLTWSHSGGLCILVGMLWVAVLSRDTSIYSAGTGLLIHRLSSVKWVGLILVLGLGVKLALTPLHWWLPGLCPHGSRWNLALSGMGIIAAAYAAARLIFYLLPGYAAAAVAWLPATLGLATVAYAGARALLSDDPCKGASHVLAVAAGQVAFGIGLGMHGQRGGLAGSLALLAPLALAAPLLAAAMGGDPGAVGVRGRSAAMIVAVWTLSGLPPLAGFWGQRTIAAAAWQAGSVAALAAALIAPALLIGYSVKVVVATARNRRAETAAPTRARFWWWVGGIAVISLALGAGSGLWTRVLLTIARKLVGG